MKALILVSVLVLMGCRPSMPPEIPPAEPTCKTESLGEDPDINFCGNWLPIVNGPITNNPKCCDNFSATYRFQRTADGDHLQVTAAMYDPSGNMLWNAGDGFIEDRRPPNVNSRTIHLAIPSSVLGVFLPRVPCGHTLRIFLNAGRRDASGGISWLECRVIVFECSIELCLEEKNPQPSSGGGDFERPYRARLTKDELDTQIQICEILEVAKELGVE